MGGWADIGLDVVLLYILPVQKYCSKVFSSYFQGSHCQESKAEDARLCVVCVPGIALGIQRLSKNCPLPNLAVCLDVGSSKCLELPDSCLDPLSYIKIGIIL